MEYVVAPDTVKWLGGPPPQDEERSGPEAAGQGWITPLGLPPGRFLDIDAPSVVAQLQQPGQVDRPGAEEHQHPQADLIEQHGAEI